MLLILFNIVTEEIIKLLNFLQAKTFLVHTDLFIIGLQLLYFLILHLQTSFLSLLDKLIHIMSPLRILTLDLPLDLLDPLLPLLRLLLEAVPDLLPHKHQLGLKLLGQHLPGLELAMLLRLL